MSSESPSALRCFIGGLISGAIALPLYFLTIAIVESFAAKPVSTTNYLAANIGVAVRTLVTGGCALATFIFGFSAIGLIALGIQTSFSSKARETPENID